MENNRVAVDVHGHAGDLAELVRGVLGWPVGHHAEVRAGQRLGLPLVTWGEERRGQRAAS